MSASTTRPQLPATPPIGRGVARIGLALGGMVVTSASVALFLALQYFDAPKLHAATRGNWADGTSARHVLQLLPFALAIVFAVWVALAWRLRTAPQNPLPWAGSLMEAAKPLGTLVLLAPTLWYDDVNGRQLVAALVVAATLYRMYPAVLGGRTWPAGMPRLPVHQVAALTATVAGGLYFAGAYLRHDALWSSLIDLGLFYELFDTADGGLLWSPTLGHSFLGEHFSPSLALLWPAMKIFPSPVTLLAIQSASVAFGGWLLFRIAQARVQDGAVALAFMVAYLASPWVQGAVFFDFHMDMLEPPMLFGLVLALQRGRWRWVWLCAALLWLTKEDTFLYTTVIGAYAWGSLGQRRTGLALMTVGLVWGVLLLTTILPGLRPPHDPAFFTTQSADTGYAFLARYSHLGTTVGDIFVTLVTNPLYVLDHLTSGAVLSSVLALLLSFGGLALWSRWHLLLLLPALEMLLANPGRLSHFKYYYGAVALMLAPLAAIEGVRRLRQRPPRLLGTTSPQRLAAALGTMSLMLLLWHPYSWLSAHHVYKPVSITPHQTHAHMLMDRVPTDVRVSATGYVAVHLQQARHVSLFPFGLDTAEWVFVDRQRPSWPQRNSGVRSHLLRLAMRGFVVVDSAALETGIFLLRRDTERPHAERVKTRQQLLKALDTPTLEAELSEYTAFMAGVETDDNASNGAFRRVGTASRSGSGHLHFGPYLTLSPGTYRAAFRIRWEPTGWLPVPAATPVVTLDVTVKRGRKKIEKAVLTLANVEKLGVGIWHSQALEFDIKPGQTDVELRVLYHDIGQLDLDVIRLEHKR